MRSRTVLLSLGLIAAFAVPSAIEQDQAGFPLDEITVARLQEMMTAGTITSRRAVDLYLAGSTRSIAAVPRCDR